MANCTHGVWRLHRASTGEPVRNLLHDAGILTIENAGFEA
jgi:hypothetical protein